MLVAHEPQVSEMLPDAEELRAAQPWVYEMGETCHQLQTSVIVLVRPGSHR